MKILILSFYFEPDLCAGSFRNTALVRGLSSKLTANDLIEVITTAPNRYHSFSASAPQYEVSGNVRIHRISLPTHKSGLLDQARAFVSYSRGILQSTHKQDYDIVYASSSRLMTAALGAIIARRMRVPLYLDIRDIFTETIGDLFARTPLRYLLPIFKYVERFSIRTARRVNLVSPAFTGHFNKIDETKIYRHFTNGVDSMQIENGSDGQLQQADVKEILYAGNIGQGQGLHKIIPGIAQKLDPTWRIRIIGDGGQRQELQEAVSRFDNVIIEEPIQRSEIFKRYQYASVLFLHLNDYPVFEKVLPSKIFEYAASGKPLVAGVRGLTAKFLNDNVENVAIFPPCDVEGFFEALDTLRLEDTPRKRFCDQYQRDRIQAEMIVDMLSLIDSDGQDLESTFSKEPGV